MCGIFGHINVSHDKLATCRASLNTMEKRGPDQWGEWYNENIYLGHRRLSIIDLSEGGKQPMHYKHYTIVFNGEIYNYLEIKKTLKQKGHVFVSSSDTEVILHAYEEYGIECLEHFNGMFALCIYDKRKHEIFVARDRLGQKPLYYSNENNELIFASEIKAIKNSFNGLNTDYSAVYDYFTYGYIPAPKSLYKEIKKIEAGHYFTYSLRDKNIVAKRYWNPDINSTKASPISVITKIEELLEDSVNLRLRSDVPVGVFLSAGLDSTTIASRLKTKNTTYFNVDFKDGETEKVIAFCKEKKLNLKVEKIEEIDYKTVFNTIIPYFDEPLADNSSIPTYLINKTAANAGFKVMLSGDGGDELFVGYKRYKQLELFKIPGKKLIKPFAKGFDTFYPGKKITKALNFLSLTNIRDYYIKLNGGYLKEELSNIFSEEFLQEFKNYNSYWLYDKYWCNDDISVVKKAQVFDIFTYLPDDILVKGDRTSMANSLELRSPFLDYRLYELILSLNLESYYNGTLKSSLKSIQKKYLPNYILGGKKKGFGYNYNELILDDKFNQIISPNAKNFLLKQKKIFFLNSLGQFLDNE